MAAPIAALTRMDSNRRLALGNQTIQFSRKAGITMASGGSATMMVAGSKIAMATGATRNPVTSVGGNLKVAVAGNTSMVSSRPQNDDLLPALRVCLRAALPEMAARLSPRQNSQAR